MKKNIKYEMSECETLIMNYLWEHSEGKSFNEIMLYLNNVCNKDWKKQTINTFIKRLMNKGLVISQSLRNCRIYSSAVSMQEYKKGEARTYLNEVHQGSFNLFLSALTGGKKIDAEMEQRLLDMLDDGEEH